MSLLVGLTGGMGAGKTLASSFFQELGAYIIDADLICRKLVESGQPALKEIAEKDKVPGVKFGTVATENSGINFSTSLGIRSVPTTHIFHKGKILGTQAGFIPENEFISFVKKTAKV